MAPLMSLLDLVHALQTAQGHTIMATPQRDGQTVTREGDPAGQELIAGVAVRECKNVLTRSGSLLEVFRSDWPELSVVPAQVNWVVLWPQGVTDWHRHLEQTDHLVFVFGVIKLCLHDDREDSPTRGSSNIFRFGDLRPAAVVVPPGVWHGLRNETGAPAGFLNYFATPYSHEDPDNWRLSHDSPELPCPL
jgi:dTDP-4-dehydrorhamnose 3,5-epimerase